MASAREEGRAAFKLRGYSATNPYRKFLDEQRAAGKDPDARIEELAREFDAGLVSAYPNPYS